MTDSFPRSSPAATAAAADALLAALDDGTRRTTRLGFDDPRRDDWSYFPGPRPGLGLHDAGRDASRRVSALLRTVLSASGLAQALTITALEDVLDAVTGDDRRSRTDYWVTVFGEPGDAQWGWRLEGHHLSVNVTVVGGEVVATPLFFGANPARVGPREAPAVAPLAVEEDLARALVTGLDEASQRRAVVASSPPSDIRTGFSADVGDQAPAVGIAGRDLDGRGAERLRRLVDVYVDRLAPPLARRVRDELVLDDVHLGWAGGLAPGEPHAYRLRATRLLVEYDNTQDGADHVHTVVRDPDDDFGAGLLAAHYAEAH